MSEAEQSSEVYGRSLSRERKNILKIYSELNRGRGGHTSVAVGLLDKATDSLGKLNEVNLAVERVRALMDFPNPIH